MRLLVCAALVDLATCFASTAAAEPTTIETAVFGTLEVPLQHPLGARRVLSVY